MTILVWSAGFNHSLPQHGSSRNIIEENEAWFKFLKGKKQFPQKMIVLNGSFDQSLDGVTNSCLPHFKEICRYLGAQFDPFLMADLYSGVEPGTTYENAIHRSGEVPLAWLFDESKLSILLAQMHKLAAEYPNQNIKFIFSDGNVNILNQLKRFFYENKNLIPNNVKLSLFCVNGTKDDFLKYIPIQGTGRTQNYVNLVTGVAAVAIEEAIANGEFLVDNDGLYILNINDARRTNFAGLTTLNFLNYYKSGQEPEHPLNNSLPYYPKQNYPKQSFVQRHKASLIVGFSLLGTLIGAAVGVALCLTGVFAPFGLGLLGLCAFAAATAFAGTWISGIITTLCLTLESSGNKKGGASSSYGVMSERGLSGSYGETASSQNPLNRATLGVSSDGSSHSVVCRPESKPFSRRPYSADSKIPTNCKGNRQAAALSGDSHLSDDSFGDCQSENGSLSRGGFGSQH